MQRIVALARDMAFHISNRARVIPSARDFQRGKLRWLNYEVVGKLILNPTARFFKLRMVIRAAVTLGHGGQRRGTFVCPPEACIVWGTKDTETRWRAQSAIYLPTSIWRFFLLPPVRFDS